MSHPNTPNNQKLIDKNPFEGLCILNDSFLNDLQGRHPCSKCGKSRKYYCYSCYLPIKELEESLPRIKLPVKIDIIKHKNEIDGKSTSAHAAIIAPDDVKVYTYPDIPSYENEHAILIFPSYSSLEVNQLFNNNYEDIKAIKCVSNVELPKGYNKTTLRRYASVRHDSISRLKELKELPIKKAVFIDSTWTQSKGIYKDERIKSLPSVVLQNRISQFWRHQKGSPRWYLATIEAIHQFVVEVHINAWGVHPEYRGLSKCFNENSLWKMEDFVAHDNDIDNAYNGQYDNLLFFFRHMYYLIHSYYDHDNLYAYKRRLM
ncbi:hypothetical protein Trydic_g20145 [Trypoxylus dichotomus]